jgi:surfeit locus 1 family protein
MFIDTIKQLRLFSVSVGSYTFSPGLLSSLLTTALLYTMFSLGFWQLDRAEFKDTLQQKIVERKNLAPINLNASLDMLPTTSEDRRYRPVNLVGRYDSAHSFLLDNKIFNGRVGYHVFTPLKIDDVTTVLVNRGFISQGATRQQLPNIISAKEPLAISGLLDMEPSRGLILADNVQDTTQWPAVLQYVDINEISELLGYSLYDMVLWLDKVEVVDNTAGSFDYDLPVLNLNSAKNNGYAFQWFAMSLALLLIYLFVNTKKIN